MERARPRLSAADAVVSEKGPIARFLSNPARTVLLIFMGTSLLGAGLFMLPWLHSEEPLDFVDALFTSVSAVTVTGLSVIDVGSTLTMPGQIVLLVLIQLGGLGILAIGSLLILLLNRKLGLRSRLLAQGETRSLTVGDVKGVIWRIVVFSLTVEAILAGILIWRFRTAHGMSDGEAVWQGIFHAVSAYNHAGFSLFSDSLTQFAADEWVVLSVAFTIILSSLGFPVILEMLRLARADNWRTSLHTRLTIQGTVWLTVLGWVIPWLLEFRNRATVGALPWWEQASSMFFHSATMRSAGLNVFNNDALLPETMLFSDVLMFIGGGSASVAGGIKITTIAVLLYAFLSQIRGDNETEIGDRTLLHHTVMEAGAVVLAMVTAVLVGTFLLLVLTPHGLTDVLFEVISATATVGASLGITAELSSPAEFVLMALMLLGRLGPITLGTAFAVRQSRKAYRLPEARPIVG